MGVYLSCPPFFKEDEGELASPGGGCIGLIALIKLIIFRGFSSVLRSYLFVYLRYMSNQQPFPVIYACIWKANESDATFSPQEFEARIPRLMQWLKDLHAKGKLVACGGGGFENHSGGLTLIKADSIEEAIELSSGTPMNEIGTTEIMVWDIFYGNLQVTEREEKLKA